MAFHYSPDSTPDSDRSIPNRFLHPDRNGKHYRSGPHGTPSRQRSSTPSRLEYNQEQVSLSMLQSMSATLSSIQAQLFMMQQQYIRQDEQLISVQESISAIQEKQHTNPVVTTCKSRKSQRGLSACVRNVHTSLPERKQYRANERAKSPHNNAVTQSIVDKVKGQDYPDASKIAYAAKKYHEYLVRLQKPVDEEIKRQQERISRRVQRRQRLLERRTKYAIGDEFKVVNVLSEKYMSDEETDDEDDQFFIHRTLPWRSPELNKLILKIDKRYNKNKDDSRPLKPRREGKPSARTFPKNPIPWAICAQATGGSESTEHQVDAPAPLLEADEDAVNRREFIYAESQLSSYESDEDSNNEMDDWLKNSHWT